MFFQQKFTQIKMEGQDPAVAAQQKMMAWMMPIIFGFIFYTMPSGLVIYWLTSNIMTIMNMATIATMRHVNTAGIPIIKTLAMIVAVNSRGDE